jgi:hypothetical protein
LRRWHRHTSRRSIGRGLDWFSGVLIVDIKTERRQNVLDDGEVRASAGVEEDVEGFETGSLESSRCGGGSGDGAGVDAELDRVSTSASTGFFISFQAVILAIEWYIFYFPSVLLIVNFYYRNRDLDEISEKLLNTISMSFPPITDSDVSNPSVRV